MAMLKRGGGSCTTGPANHCQRRRISHLKMGRTDRGIMKLLTSKQAAESPADGRVMVSALPDWAETIMDADRVVHPGSTACVWIICVCMYWEARSVCVNLGELSGLCYVCHAPSLSKTWSPFWCRKSEQTMELMQEHFPIFTLYCASFRVICLDSAWGTQHVH